MIRVYRVEHVKERVGPYNTERVIHPVEKALVSHYCAVTRPGLYQEGWARFHTPNHYFGFLNRRQLDRWFTKPQRRVLAKYGFRLYVYHTKKVAASSVKQCMFDRTKAKCVTAKKLD